MNYASLEPRVIYQTRDGAQSRAGALLVGYEVVKQDRQADCKSIFILASTPINWVNVETQAAFVIFPGKYPSKSSPSRYLKMTLYRPMTGQSRRNRSPDTGENKLEQMGGCLTNEVESRCDAVGVRFCIPP